MNDEVYFWHAEKRQNFLQVYFIILVCAARNAQSTQNRKFAYLCNIQNSKCAMSLQYLRKEVRDEVAFLHVDKHQNFPQVDFNTLSIKVFYKVILSLLMGMIKYFD